MGAVKERAMAGRSTSPWWLAVLAPLLGCGSDVVVGEPFAKGSVGSSGSVVSSGAGGSGGSSGSVVSGSAGGSGGSSSAGGSGGCAAGEVDCGGGCTDLETDPANCGACGVACGPGNGCTAGACGCECEVGWIACDASCICMH